MGDWVGFELNVCLAGIARLTFCFGGRNLDTGLAPIYHMPSHPLKAPQEQALFRKDKPKPSSLVTADSDEDEGTQVNNLEGQLCEDCG